MRLSAIAETVDDAENTRLAAWAGTPDTGAKAGVILNIRRQPGANVIATVDRIKALLPQLQRRCPPRWTCGCSPTAPSPSARA